MCFLRRELQGETFGISVEYNQEGISEIHSTMMLPWAFVIGGVPKNAINRLWPSMLSSMKKRFGVGDRIGLSLKLKKEVRNGFRMDPTMLPIREMIEEAMGFGVENPSRVPFGKTSGV